MRASARKSSIRMVTIGGPESPIGPGSTDASVTIVDATNQEQARRLARAIEQQGGVESGDHARPTQPNGSAGAPDESTWSEDGGVQFMKRISLTRSVAALAAIAVIVGACSGSATPTPAAPSAAPSAAASAAPSVAPSAAAASPSAAAKTYTIGYSNGGSVGNGFREEQVCTAKAQAKASGEVSNLTVIHRNTDAAGQLSDIRSLIAKGVNAIVFNPNDPAALNPALDEAKAAGIVTVSVDANVTDANSWNLTNNQVKYAELGAKWLFDQMGGTGTVWYTRGLAGHPADNDRDIGFKNILKQYPNIKVVPTAAGVFTGWDPAKTTQLTNDFIQSGQYDKIQGIWASGMGKQIVDAIKAANKPFVPIADVGIGDRHEWLVGGLDGVNDLLAHARRPDALDLVVLAALDEVVGQLGRLGGIPAGEHAVRGRDDLDVRVLLEDVLEPDVAVVVGRVAGETARVPDRAGATHLVEQPLGAELGVLHLVVGQVPGVRVGDVRIDGDGHDSGGLRLIEGGIERRGVVRIEDDRVDTLRDQAPDVGQLTGGVGVAMDHGEVGDLTRCLGLRLGGADLLLAEAVAHAAAVRVADRIGLGRCRRRGCRCRRRCGRRRGRRCRRRCGRRRGRGRGAAGARSDDDRDRGQRG